MQIEVADIEGGKGEFSHVYQPGELIVEDRRIQLTSPLSISGTIRKESHKIRVVGHLKADVQIECDRCLQLVDMPIESRFNLEYVTPQQYERAMNPVLGEEDLDLAVFDGENIDVDQMALEQLILSVPSQTLCDEDCKGLCPDCGTNLNKQGCGCKRSDIDPRWAALSNLKTDK